MLKCKEPPQESFHIWAIHQRRTFCQKMVYRFRYRSKRDTFLGKWHEPKKVGKETCCHRRCLHESTKIQTLIRRAWAMARPKEHPNPASYHITVRDCYAKAFAIVRNKEICQDQEWVSAYFCTSSVVWAGRDVYPTTESLDDLDVSRTGINHHVMNTTPSCPSMLSHMN